jgi:hypothetical protein
MSLKISKTLISLVYKFLLDIFARISKFDHFRGDWAYADPIFFGEISKKNFFKQFP